MVPERHIGGVAVMIWPAQLSHAPPSLSAMAGTSAADRAPKSRRGNPNVRAFVAFLVETFPSPAPWDVNLAIKDVAFEP
jgi:hypothetical protein